MMEQAAMKVSMLMDGELDQRKTVQLLRDLQEDESLREHWRCYHLIGDAMRSNLPDNNSQALTTSIFKALEDEPALTPSSNVVYPSFIKPVAGLALAASVAAVTVIGFQWGDSSNINSIDGVSPQIANMAPETTDETFDLNDPAWIVEQSEFDYSLNDPVNEYGNDVYVVPRKPHSVNLVDFESN